MNKGTYLVGVDIGTMGTKAAVFDQSGGLLGDAFEESKLVYPRAGWVEQDMEDMYGSCLRTMNAAVQKAGIEPRRVASIAVDGQMAGIGGVAEDGTASIRYDSWLDTRCEPYIDLMNREAGGSVLSISGSPPTYDHGPKILWWMHEEPEAFRRTAKFVVPSAYAAMRMSGLAAADAFIDYTQLHFSGFGDTQNLTWSQELCDAFGVPVEKLPRIVGPCDIVGKLTAEAADRAGLVPGIPIAAGAGDQAATSLGAGIVEPGQVFDVAGTASVFSVCADRRVVDVLHRTFLCARSVVRDLWVPIAYINGGGLCLRWFRDEIGLGKLGTKATGQAGNVYALLDQEAAKAPPGADGLVFLPHFGGRVTPNDPNVRGAWVGLTWGHNAAHLYRAILEGVAYEYRYYADILAELLPDLELKEARVIGGGAKSSIWNQIKANVLGIPYVQLDRSEVAVWGSALIAGYAVGVFEDLVGAAKAFTRPVNRVLPDQGAYESYQPYVRVYKGLFDALRTSFEVIRTAKARETTRAGGRQ
ncbi:MAG: FGGY family carbohydrate kinase [Firmicutes bacterium]|jgi:xylulokinase|nr:FGGY family carbohydrate kinase [Bacillota bacterium]MDH7494745.1 FGGY family carbohydrate kinase [Bacillota bacterium]